MASQLAALKYCHCTNPIFSFQTAHVEPSPVRELGNEVWVCDRCSGIHHSRQVPVTIPRTPKNAITVLSEHGRSDGVKELTFAMPDGSKQMILTVQPYDRRPVAMGINPNDILLRTWEMLDQAIKEIKESNHAMDQTYQKARARALCDTLALMMPPFFKTADEIGHEALRRYDARQAEDTDYETPGLGVKSLSYYDTQPQLSRPKAAAKVSTKLDAATQANIKMAMESGLFTAEQLATSYSVTVAEIESCVTP